MKAQFRILSGARIGQTEVHSRKEITVGRHPSCDFRFDPDQDLDVSTRHATIARSGNNWIVRDLQSRNGTLVNGHPIKTDTKLDDTDQIQFGKDGPKVEFRAVADSVADTPPAVFPHEVEGARLRPSSNARPTPEPVASPTTRSGAPSGGSTTQRIRVEVAKQTKKFRTVSLSLVAALLIAVGVFVVYNQLQERERKAEVAAIKASTDEALKTVQSQLRGLTEALQRSQTEVKQLQTELASAQASGNRAQIAQLSKRLDEANASLRNQQMAAQVDYRGINSANQRSVALIYAKFGPTEVYTGTAFAVRNTGLLVTNRHVVAGDDGTRRALDLALKFADSPQTFKATLVKLSPESDLAVVKVENLEGTVPVVRGINARSDTVQPGDPVAMIGFPLGVELPMGSDGATMVMKTSFGPGTVSKVLPDRLQIDGYSAQGASGSPIFDRNGEVIAVLYGGQEGTNGRVLYAVPASFVSKLLQSIN
jgi:S1-C subfamily serine protease/pSer/pThr/pTyr-binding forkhead associated (FHA) protein